MPASLMCKQMGFIPNHLFILPFLAIVSLTANAYAQDSPATQSAAPTNTFTCKCSCPACPNVAPPSTTKQATASPSADNSGNSTTSAVTSLPERNVGADYIKHPGRVGLGVTGGLPTIDLSVKVFILKNLSLQLNASYYYNGYLFVSGPCLGASLDLFYETPPFYRGETIDLAWQVGLGSGVATTLDFREAVPTFNLNIGFQLLFTQVPLELTFAYQPEITLNPYRDQPTLPYERKKIVEVIPVGANISLRYYF